MFNLMNIPDLFGSVKMSDIEIVQISIFWLNFAWCHFKLGCTSAVLQLWSKWYPRWGGGGERSGSVVGGLTRDRGAAGSSLTGVTALCPSAKTLIIAKYWFNSGRPVPLKLKDCWWAVKNQIKQQQTNKNTQDGLSCWRNGFCIFLLMEKGDAGPYRALFFFKVDYQIEGK